MTIRHGRLARCAAVAIGAVVLVAVAATPAFAHATLEQTTPTPGQVLDTSPKDVTLRFSEPVEAALGAIRLYDSRGDQVEIGNVSHPGGEQSQVRATVPDLDDDSYVVTWRVLSADAHPVRGAFTFQLGEGAAAGNLQGLTDRLLAEQGGDRTVGVLYAIARFTVFASLALLIGAAAFLVLMWPRARESKGVARIVWTGWIGALIATVVGIPLEGAYAGALPLGDVFDPTVTGDVFDTRFGRVWLLRLVLLLAAIPLLRLLVNRRPVVEYPLPRWWRPAAVAVGVGLLFTPGLSGHASSGRLVPVALLSDPIHLGAVSLWLGGLVVLVAVTLRPKHIDELRDVVPRFSRMALAAVGVIVATGVFQAWRQLGSISDLRDTDYGKLLAAKLLVVGALIIAAAFSREIVNRRFKAPRPAPAAHPRVPVPAGGPPLPPGGDEGRGGHGSGGGGDENLDETEIDAWEARNLRRHVGLEVVFAIVILAITSLLVNAAPAVSVNESGASGVTLRAEDVRLDVTATPGRPGRNELHFTLFTTAGAPLALPQIGGLDEVGEFTVTASLPDRDIAPIEIPVRRISPSHYIATGTDLPIPGDWRLTVRALQSETDQVGMVGELPIR